MPRAAMDYSKTNIYKIVCNDLTVKDCYVGHTTDMTKRKYRHKFVCNNEKDKAHNFKIYQIIRENGGWENWDMVLVEKFPCKDKFEACKRERELYEELDAKMNTYRPHRTQEELKEEHRQNDKQYKEKNKEVIAEKQKQYREEHKAEKAEKNKQYNQEHKKQISEYGKQYYQDRKEVLAEKHKQYREDHKEELKEKRKGKIECEYCAEQITKRHMSSHLKRCKSKGGIASQ